MYEELKAIWLKETKDADLCSIDCHFYDRLAAYMKKIKEENKMLDKKTTKSLLLERELQNVRRMIHELVWLRYRKIVRLVSEGTKLPSDTLSFEEQQIVNKLTPIADAHQAFSENILLGQLLPLDSPNSNKRITLRFKKEIPSIIGADMQSYGPFLPEDVASVPTENARILMKQGLAELVQSTC